MSKDPAFLFYPSDFLSGTMFFTDEQTGKYIRLLCAQHQHGSLTQDQMMFICKSYDSAIWAKFDKDDDGNFFQHRLKEEIEKRVKYCESRGNNKRGKTKLNDMKNISKSCDDDMGNRNRNEDTIGVEKSKTIQERIEDFKAKINELNHGFTNGQLEAFITYWTVINPGDRKMAFELEKKFYFSRRIATWKSNDKKFSKQPDKDAEAEYLKKITVQ